MAARNRPSSGGKPDKLIRDALMLELRREAQDADGKPTKKLRLLAEKLMERALDGDVAAIKEVADRVDGKPTQAIEHGGEAFEGIAASLNALDNVTRGLPSEQPAEPNGKPTTH